MKLIVHSFGFLIYVAVLLRTGCSGNENNDSLKGVFLDAQSITDKEGGRKSVIDMQVLCSLNSPCNPILTSSRVIKISKSIKPTTSYSSLLGHAPKKLTKYNIDLLKLEPNKRSSDSPDVRLTAYRSQV